MVSSLASHGLPWGGQAAWPSPGPTPPLWKGQLWTQDCAFLNFSRCEGVHAGLAWAVLDKTKVLDQQLEVHPSRGKVGIG
jgi:hypothetical protein